MTTWICQRQPDNDRRRLWYAEIEAACKATGQTFIEIDIVPFERSVVGGDPVVDGTVVLHGSTAINDLQKRMHYSPGIWESDYLLEETAYAELGSLYLNSDMKKMHHSKVVDYVTEQGYDFFFVKPDCDDKVFDGMVTDAKKYPFMIENSLQYHGTRQDFDVCVSSLKVDLGREWRLFVVDGQVVASSQYRKNRHLSVDPSTPKEVIDFAREAMWMRDTNPVDAYVMDIGEYKGELKVIEYNTFNFSGFYACNIYNIVKAVGDVLGEKNE